MFLKLSIQFWLSQDFEDLGEMLNMRSFIMITDQISSKCTTINFPMKGLKPHLYVSWER